MARRVPLWLTFVPLLIGIAGYYWFWSGYAAKFRAEVAAVLPGSTAAIGGFPYRIEATLDAPRYSIAGPGVTATLSADTAAATRGPWRPELTVVRIAAPHMTLAVTPLAGATLDLAAPAALSSIHVEAGRLLRLSTVFDHPKLTLGLLPVPVSAARLEVHLRETPALAAVIAPTPPRQAQLVISGSGVRLGQGAPLALDADLAVTAAARLRSYAGWAARGTVEIARLTLADASGTVLTLAATAVPVDSKLQFAGTIDTVCPASVAAAFAGIPPLTEQRTRRPVRLAFAGTPGALRLSTAVPTGLATRAQLPPCPVLRG